MKQFILKYITVSLFLFAINGFSQSSNYYGLKKMRLIETFENQAVRNFYMDETPVTYADFKNYVRAGGQKNAYWYYESYNIDVQPVTGISWHEAVDYCNWRSKCEGLKPVYHKIDLFDNWGYPVYERDSSANGYRLPTSEEFESAAKADNKSTKFIWGDTFYDSLANYDNDRGHKTTEWWRLAPVKSQYKNSFGLYNMCGNIWHWCDDWKDENKTKYLKGSSWGTIAPSMMTPEKISWSSPGNYNYDIGFRCVRNALGVKDSVAKIDTTIKHEFYSHTEQEVCSPVKNFYDEEFVLQLSRFIDDNYPECINFLMKVDEQEIINAQQMAQLIVTVCQRNKVNPLFLACIMISESGFGTVSFPRWFNNPMAFHWQNKLMTNGLPVYDAKPGVTNRKYKTLEAGFEAFCKGIRRDLYYKAAKKNLDSFHLIYVGYRADQWMLTLSRVYRDIAGIRFEPKFPETDAGKYIYEDWEYIKKNIK